MVECGFGDPSREDQWNTWYSGPKLDALLAVADFLSAQRFKALDTGPAPYLNVTTIESARMFNSSSYRGHGGGAFGPWPVELILDWDRRLFCGSQLVPAVQFDERLLLVDRQQADAEELGVPLTWLEGRDWQELAQYDDGAALDQSVRFRGFAVLSVEAASQLSSSEQMRLYQPICPYRTI